MRRNHAILLLCSFAILIASRVAVAADDPTEPKPVPKRPNIVIIYADDMGHGDLGIQNKDSKIPTPRLDQLAREGMRFTDAHSSSGICTPSRYALLTGRYHWRKFHGIVQAFGPSAFDKGELTMPEMFKKQGYTTACIGKWHLGWDWNAIKRPGAKAQGRRGYTADAFDWSKPIPDGPLAHGFDYYFGDDVPNFPPYTWIENDRVVDAPTVPYVPDPKPTEGNPEGRPGPMVAGWQQDQVMPRLTEKAVEWIGQQKGSDDPFFLYFPWTSPHAPIVPTKEFQGTTKAGGYGDFMAESDWCAGQVLDALEANGFSENTLVIFTADNGPEKYAYDRIRNHEHRSMGELRGLKRDIWEGGHRVPMVIRWPGVVEAGTVSESLVSQIDLMATLAAVVGHELPNNVAEDSYDQLPLLRGLPEIEAIRTAHVHNTRPGQFAIRHHDWLLINARSGGMSAVPAWFDEANGYKNDGKPAALYNLRDDLAEKHNLLEKHPAKVAELRNLLAQIRKFGNRSSNRYNHTAIAPQGIMVGEVTHEQALVQVRLSQNDDVRVRETPGAEDWWVEFKLSPVGSTDEQESQSQLVAAKQDRDHIARARFAELKAGTEYEVTTLIGRAEALRQGPVAHFKTLPGAELAKPVRFAVVTGMNYAKFHGDNRIDRAQHLIENNTELPRPYAGPDKHLGYPALASILKAKPDFFVGTGDNVYYDTPDKPRAETIPELRGKWQQQFAQPRYHDLFAEVPTYWEIDDHDYRIDDGDNTGDYKPTPSEGRALMLEQLPIASHDETDAVTYRTHRVSKDLQIWLTEGRIHRSPNAMPDGPDKSMWGAKQKAWLKRTLAESDATYKLLISPTPMVGPDDLRKTDNHTNIGGFRHERDEFFAWLKETGIDKKGFHIVCGDRHWQYHAVHPTGIEEFSCGALVDANSRLGRKPGDPKSTDPEGLIKQPYYQTPRSGGYLIIEVAPAKEGNKASLAFRWHDEHGELLHEHVKEK